VSNWGVFPLVNNERSLVVLYVYCFTTFVILIRYYTLIMKQDTTLFDKDIKVSGQSKQGMTDVKIKTNEFYAGTVSGTPKTLLIHFSIILNLKTEFRAL